MASEIVGPGPDEHLLLRHYSNSVTGIIGNCNVSVHPSYDYSELDQLIDPVIEIGHTVGCSAYVDDFVAPEYPSNWPKFGWTAIPGGDGPPFLRPPDVDSACRAHKLE